MCARAPSEACGILKYGGSVNTRAGLASKPICNHVHGAARRDCSDAVSSTRSLRSSKFAGLAQSLHVQVPRE